MMILMIMMMMMIYIYDHDDHDDIDDLDDLVDRDGHDDKGHGNRGLGFRSQNPFTERDQKHIMLLFSVEGGRDSPRVNIITMLMMIHDS